MGWVGLGGGGQDGGRCLRGSATRSTGAGNYDLDRLRDAGMCLSCVQLRSTSASSSAALVVTSVKRDSPPYRTNKFTSCQRVPRAGLRTQNAPVSSSGRSGRRQQH
jgi:hypothetical protein